MLKVINHFKAICIHCLLHTIYAATFHNTHNLDAENISHFIHIWRNLLVAFPKKSKHKLVLSLPHRMDRNAMPCQHSLFLQNFTFAVF